jgi:hypothetical protein
MRVILMLVMLAACNTSRDEVTMENGEKVEDHSKHYKTICINGVTYYVGNRYNFAPRFDPKTKQVVTCE